MLVVLAVAGDALASVAPVVEALLSLLVVAPNDAVFVVGAIVVDAELAALLAVVTGAMAALLLLATATPVAQPVSPAAKRAAPLTTMRDVLVQRCKRNDTMLE